MSNFIPTFIKNPPTIWDLLRTGFPGLGLMTQGRYYVHCENSCGNYVYSGNEGTSGFAKWSQRPQQMCECAEQ